MGLLPLNCKLQKNHLINQRVEDEPTYRTMKNTTFKSER